MPTDSFQIGASIQVIAESKSDSDDGLEPVSAGYLRIVVAAYARKSIAPIYATAEKG
jgi:hypothetical protein